MHKEELINLHQMLSEVKDYFEEINPELKFSQYNALKISPSQQHKSKMEHKYAIFVLGTEIANAMKEVDYTFIEQDIGTDEGTCRQDPQRNGLPA